jgi:hypothetical protein
VGDVLENEKLRHAGRTLPPAPQNTDAVISTSARSQALSN